MIDLPENLKVHLAGEVTTHCFCWRLTRTDETVLGFTDHDRTISFAGTIFDPQTGFNASEATNALGLSIDSAEVEGALSSSAIGEADIEAGLYEGATIETFLVNWQAPEDHVRLRRATIGTITRTDAGFTAELKSGTARLDRVRGRHVTRRCDAELGDARCGVDTANPVWSGAGTVSATDAAGFAATGLAAFSSGWFGGGRLLWTAGENAGRRFIVQRHALENGTVRLVLRDPPTGAIAPGDTFTIFAGCDKSFAECRAKFGNGENFRGFPHLPGNDAAYAYANGNDEFDGGPLVP